MLGLTACSRTVRIASDPPGAEVLVDGRPLAGHAPLQESVRGRWISEGKEAHHVVEARLPGMASGVYRLDPTEIFWPGAIGCVALIGLGCPWVSQIPDEVNLKLYPLAEGRTPERPTESLPARLQRLERLWKEGKISDREYEESRQKALQDVNQ
jgi:hypothetical protein